MESTEKNSFNNLLMNLPEELLVHIFSMLDFKTLLKLAEVSKTCKRISETPHLWFFDPNPRNEFILRSRTVRLAKDLVAKNGQTKFIKICLLNDYRLKEVFEKLKPNDGAFEATGSIKDYLFNIRVVTKRFLEFEKRYLKLNRFGIVLAHLDDDREITEYMKEIKRISKQALLFFVTNKEKFSSLSKYATNLLFYNPDEPITTFYTRLMDKVEEIANHFPENKSTVRCGGKSAQ